MCAAMIQFDWLASQIEYATIIERNRVSNKWPINFSMLCIAAHIMANILYHTSIYYKLHIIFNHHFTAHSEIPSNIMFFYGFQHHFLHWPIPFDASGVRLHSAFIECNNEWIFWTKYLFIQLGLSRPVVN